MAAQIFHAPAGTPVPDAENRAVNAPTKKESESKRRRKKSDDED